MPLVVACAVFVHNSVYTFLFAHKHTHTQDKEVCTVNEANIYNLDEDAPNNDIDSRVTLEVCVLVGMLLLLRAAVYYALVRKTSVKKKSSSCSCSWSWNPFKLCTK